MTDINRVIFTGRIGNDLELKQTQSGVSVCTIRLAVERMKAKDAEKADTDWFTLVCWRSQAEFAVRYLGKGKKICVECSARVREWEDKEGGKRSSVEFVTERIVPMDYKPDARQTATATAEVKPEEFKELDVDDDLPFWG